MAYESQKDMEAKAKRMAELEGLIHTATMALEVAGDGEKATARKKRARLMQERLWYENGHAFSEWPAFIAQMEAQEAAAAKAAAEQAKTEAEKKAAAEKNAAEREAAERAEWERENDPFLIAKRAKATRTF